MHKCDEYAEKGEVGKINAIHLGAGFVKAFITSSVVFITIAIGTDAVSRLVYPIFYLHFYYAIIHSVITYPIFIFFVCK